MLLVALDSDLTSASRTGVSSLDILLPSCAVSSPEKQHVKTTLQIKESLGLMCIPSWLTVTWLHAYAIQGHAQVDTLNCSTHQPYYRAQVVMQFLDLGQVRLGSAACRIRM